MADSRLVNVAGAVLKDRKGRYLMVQEKRDDIYGLWNIPAGHQDKGETLQQAAIRETYEETGLQVELIANEPIYVGPTANENHIFHAFPAEVIGGTLSIAKDEILDAKWLTFIDIKKLYKQGKVRHYSTMAGIQKVEDENIRD